MHFTFLRKKFCNFLWGSFIIFFSPSRIQVRHCKYLSHSAGAWHLLPSLLTGCSQLSPMRHQTPAQPRNRLKGKSQAGSHFWLKQGSSNTETPAPTEYFSCVDSTRRKRTGMRSALLPKKIPAKLKKVLIRGKNLQEDLQRCSESHWSFQILCYRRNSMSRTLNTSHCCLLSAACHCAPVN